MGNNSYPSGNNNANVSGPTPITQTEVHRIDANDGTSMINVYNFGACLGCHTVQMFHAAPVPGVDYQSAGTGGNDNLPFDQLRYGPGRGVFNILQGASGTSRDCTTETWQQHRLASQYCNRQYNGARGDTLMNGIYGQNPSVAQWTFGNQYASFNRTAIPAFAAGTNYEGLSGITNGQNYSGNGGGIVTFNDIAAPSIPDNVQVQSVVWNGATVTVVATNDDGCSALSARTQPDGVVRISAGGFTGTGICTGTFALGSISGVTVDVETTNAAGTDSTGNAIDDQSCNPITVSISGTPTWTPTAIGIGTLAVNATTSVSVTGAEANYNGSNYAMSGSGTSWSLSQGGVPYSSTVTASSTDADNCGQSSPAAVSNLGDVITVTTAEWTGGSLTVNVTTTQSPASVTVDYGETGTILLPMSGGGNSWTLTSSQSYLPTLRVYSSAYGEVTGVPVNNLDVTDLIVAGQANWIPGGAGGTTPVSSDNFNSYSPLATAVSPANASIALSGWSAIAGSNSINCWEFDDNSGTTSTGTGPCDTLTTGKCATAGDQYIFLETSSAPGCADAATNNWIESDVLDASANNYQVSFLYNMNVENNTDAVLTLQVWNGSTWFDEDIIQTGSAGDVWNTYGPYDLSSYSNSDMQIRIQYLTGRNGTLSGSTSYRNDVAIDDLTVETINPAGPATIEVMAANTEGATGGNVVHADYNSNTYDLNNVGGNRWSFSGEDLSDAYASTIWIYSDQDPIGRTYPVVNNGTLPGWDSISVTSAEWDGTDAVITATNTWGDQADMFADYNGSGPTLMTNTGGNNWTITQQSAGPGRNRPDSFQPAGCC